LSKKCLQKTALARRVLEKYNPEKVIVASIFYSNQGVQEVQNEIKNAGIYVIGEPDSVRLDGMLVPGFGNLDKRLKGL